MNYRSAVISAEIYSDAVKPVVQQKLQSSTQPTSTNDEAFVIQNCQLFM